MIYTLYCIRGGRGVKSPGLNMRNGRNNMRKPDKTPAGGLLVLILSKALGVNVGWMYKPSMNLIEEG